MGPSGLTLAMTLTLNFKGQIWNWLYLCQKWSDCHETINEHIDWTLGLKCDHQIWPWPWPWPWPWIFKVKYEICYISTKSGPIATRQKANISIWTLGLKFDNGFDLGHDLDILIFKVICDLDQLVTKVRCKDLPDSDRGDFSCRRAVDSSSCLWRKRAQQKKRLHMMMSLHENPFRRTLLAIFLGESTTDVIVMILEPSLGVNRSLRLRIYITLVINMFWKQFSLVITLITSCIWILILCMLHGYVHLSTVRWVVAIPTILKKSTLSMVPNKDRNVIDTIFY